jgi:hypothetical protein
MSTLTLTDLLTPVQIDQAHEALANIMLAIDTEQDQELTRIHVLFEERRREARREAILKVLQGESAPVEMCVDIEASTQVIPPVDAAPVVEDAPVAVPDPEPTPLVQAYTARELAELLGIHPTSITNIKKDGLLPEPVPGTGGSPQNPFLYEIPDIEELRASVENRRVNGLRTAGEKLEAYKAGKAMGSPTPEPKEVTPEPPSVALASSEPSFGARLKAAQAVAREGLKLEYYKQRKGFVLAHRMADDSWRHSILGTPLESGWAAVLFFEMEGGRCVPVQGISMRNGLIGEIGKHLADSYKNRGRI